MSRITILDYTTGRPKEVEWTDPNPPTEQDIKNLSTPDIPTPKPTQVSIPRSSLLGPGEVDIPSLRAQPSIPAPVTSPSRRSLIAPPRVPIRSRETQPGTPPPLPNPMADVANKAFTPLIPDPWESYAKANLIPDEQAATMKEDILKKNRPLAYETAIMDKVVRPLTSPGMIGAAILTEGASEFAPGLTKAALAGGIGLPAIAEIPHTAKSMWDKGINPDDTADLINELLMGSAAIPGATAVGKRMFGERIPEPARVSRGPGIPGRIGLEARTPQDLFGQPKPFVPEAPVDFAGVRKTADGSLAVPKNRTDIITHLESQGAKPMMTVGDEIIFTDITQTPTKYTPGAALTEGAVKPEIPAPSTISPLKGLLASPAINRALESARSETKTVLRRPVMPRPPALERPLDVKAPEISEFAGRRDRPPISEFKASAYSRQIGKVTRVPERSKFLKEKSELDWLENQGLLFDYNEQLAELHKKHGLIETTSVESQKLAQEHAWAENEGLRILPKAEKLDKDLRIAKVLSDGSKAVYHEDSPPEFIMERTTPKIEGPASAKIGKDTYAAKVDTDRMMDILGAAHADKAPRELIQNAWDTTKAIGDKRDIKVDLSADKKTLSITDNGPGLDKEGLGTYFIDPGSSGKVGVAGTSGEFGVGKTSYLLGGDMEVVSRYKDPKTGKLREFYFNSTPETIRKGFEINERTPTGKDTGVDIVFTSKKDLNPMNIYNEVEGLHGKEGHIKYTSNIPGETFWSTSQDFAEGYKKYKKLSQDLSTANIEYFYDPLTKVKGEGSLTARIKINGMPHNQANFNLKGLNIPNELIIDIDPKFPATSDKYPTNIDRTQIKPETSEKIKEFIRENILKPGQEEEINALRKAWKDATPVIVGRDSKGNKKINYIFDDEGHLTPENRTIVETHPIFRKMGEAYHDITEIIFDAIRKEGGDFIVPLDKIITNHDRLGFAFSPTKEKRWGVNFPDPDNPKKYASVLDLPWSLKSTKSPNQFLIGLLNTIKHELAHNIERGHDNSHELTINELDRILADNLPALHDRLWEGFLDANGKPHKELYDILQQVDTDSRAGGQSEFTLAGTGVHSKGPSDTGGEPGKPGGNSKPSGEGAVPGKKRSGKQREQARRREQTRGLIVDAIKEVIPLQQEQVEINTRERSNRIKNFQAAFDQSDDWQGAMKALGETAGKFEKVEYEPPTLKTEHLDEIARAIKDANLKGYEQVKAIYTIKRMFGLTDEPAVPRRSELDILEKIWPDISKELDDAGYFRPGPLVEGALEGVTKTASKLINAPKSFMSTLDFSGVFRQGIGLVHTAFPGGGGEFRRAIPDMFKAFASEKNYDAIQHGLTRDPWYSMGKRYGLSLTDLGELDAREEAFVSNVAEKFFGLPAKIGQKIKDVKGDPLSTNRNAKLYDKVPDLIANSLAKFPNPARATNRAYTAFLNKMRVETFSRLLQDAEFFKGENVTDPKAPNFIGKQLANYVNTATGRGSLGDFNKISGKMNAAFFSPRLVASRLKMLNPKTFFNPWDNGYIRKQYWKSALGMMSFGGTFLGLGLAAGGNIEIDPTSSDFMKLRFGKTRLDPWAGHQQYLVALARLMMNVSKTIEGRTYELGGKYGSPTRKDIVDRFAQGKLSPAFSFAAKLLEGKDYRGLPVDVKAEMLSRSIPLLISDLYDLYKEEPELYKAAIETFAATFGMGLQTFDDRKSLSEEISAKLPNYTDYPLPRIPGFAPKEKESPFRSPIGGSTFKKSLFDK